MALPRGSLLLLLAKGHLLLTSPSQGDNKGESHGRMPKGHAPEYAFLPEYQAFAPQPKVI